mmetsp:Transcript_4820/g.8270  ORF Transcript_4820/g.8270 Transcript_4820/m.8270 type:complete len:129 (-) Transcript_4820:982-1368(-)
MEWLFGKKEEDKDKLKPDKSILKDLKKIELISDLKMPEKPKIKTQQQKKKDAELELIKGKKPFDIEQDYDMGTYKGRFLLQLNSVNPLLFFTPPSSITEAQKEMEVYLLRREAAHKIGSQVYLEPEEI